MVQNVGSKNRHIFSVPSIVVRFVHRYLWIACVLWIAWCDHFTPSSIRIKSQTFFSRLHFCLHPIPDCFCLIGKLSIFFICKTIIFIETGKFTYSVTFHCATNVKQLNYRPRECRKNIFFSVLICCSKTLRSACAHWIYLCWILLWIIFCCCFSWYVFAKAKS